MGIAGALVDFIVKGGRSSLGIRKRSRFCHQVIITMI